MRAWEDARDLILPDVPGCPWEMAQSRLVLAARDFFGRTGAWAVTLDPIPSIVDTPDYQEIVPSENMEVIRVLECYYGTTEVEPVTPTEFFHRQMDGAGSGTPDYMTVSDDVMLLSPAPGESDIDIIVRATYKPSLTCPGLPEGLWDQHIDAIVEGAKYKLYASPKKPYSDLTLAGAALDKFVSAMGKARERASRGSTRAVRRVRAHYF